MDSVLLSAALAYRDVGVSHEQHAVAIASMDADTELRAGSMNAMNVLDPCIYSALRKAVSKSCLARCLFGETGSTPELNGNCPKNCGTAMRWLYE